MKRVSRKNIDPGLVDIRRPDFNYRHLKRMKVLNLMALAAEKPNRWRPALKTVFAVAVGLVVFGGASGAVGIWNLRAKLASQSRIIRSNLLASAESFRKMDVEGAARALQANANTLAELDASFRRGGNRAFLGSVGLIVPAVKDAFGLIGKISDFNGAALDFAMRVADLKENGFTYFRSDGAVLVTRLRSLRAKNGEIIGHSADIKNTFARLKKIAPVFATFDSAIGTNYVKYSSDFQTWDEALDALVDLLDTKVEKHVLLVFHNPSEMRPGGGFIGSFGDLTIVNGAMTNLEVQDIYWPDHPMNLEAKVVPPEPLQNITKNWGARDANWFFDFPTSAETVLGFLERSKVYADRGVRFEGVVGLNAFVLQSMITAVGPIEIPEYKLTITAENFLAEIQREIELGRDHRPGQNPKKVLSVLAPLLLERLDGLDVAAKKGLSQALVGHIQHKDIMVYMRDSRLRHALQTGGIDGSVYDLPDTFWGGYLAVVNANIAGGKSDVFIKESTEGQIDINTDGSLFVNLKVTRKHTGDKEKDPWYRTDNQNFIQILTNPDARLVSISGNTAKRQPKTIDYDAEKYERNAAVEAIEKTKVFIPEAGAWTEKMFSKNAFAAWLVVPAGKEKSLEVRYTVPGEKNFTIEPEKPFRLVIERQSGVSAAFRWTVNAPLGYVFRESNDPRFVFERPDPESREEVELHLVRS